MELISLYSVDGKKRGCIFALFKLQDDSFKTFMLINHEPSSSQMEQLEENFKNKTKPLCYFCEERRLEIILFSKDEHDLLDCNCKVMEICCLVLDKDENDEVTSDIYNNVDNIFKSYNNIINKIEDLKISKLDSEDNIILLVNFKYNNIEYESKFKFKIIMSNEYKIYGSVFICKSLPDILLIIEDVLCLSGSYKKLSISIGKDKVFNNLINNPFA